MIKPFNIVRDLENKSFTSGSDSIVLTQFDNNVYIDFDILVGGRGFTWSDQYSAKITLKNGGELIAHKQACTLEGDKWRYKITTALTEKTGNVKGIIDIEKNNDNTRVASSQFELVILEHLATH